MTRRYAPRSIDVGHGDTQAAEARREWARPRQEPHPAPASWEATPEPAPTPQPKPGPPKRVVVRSAPEGGLSLNADQTRALRQSLRETEANATTAKQRRAARAARAALECF